jgi:CheY-like chemotaxis protein
MNAQLLPARRRRPCTVLVVDDHDESRLTQRLVLEYFGFVVTEARTGLDALALAQANLPRIVLLDIVLPEIDGRQLARMLRADPSTRNVALLAVSALSGPEERERALTAGCDEFISKPVPPLHLVRMVRLYARRDERPVYDFDPLEMPAQQ